MCHRSGPMNRSRLSDAAFVAPDGQNAVAVRDLTEALVDQLLSQLTGASERPPLPIDPDVPHASIPANSTDATELLTQIETIVNGSMNPADPE